MEPIQPGSLKEAGKEIAMSSVMIVLSSVMSCKIGFEKHLSCKTYFISNINYLSQTTLVSSRVVGRSPHPPGGWIRVKTY